GRIDAWQCALTYNGYEEAAVAAAMDELANRLFTLAGPVPAPVADLIQNMRFPIAPRGRDRKQVDRFMTELADELRKRAAL
ncbi:MAG: DivIVA domain-containing protein, partial [Acidimicrobiia bacterium]|nr:DivIVA domain-containing protein [Acidimicrobiia bacterium]